MHKMKFILTLALFLYGYSICLGQNTADTTRVLFVGNSYTYFWNLPQVVQAMAQSQSIPLITRQSTAGGATWDEHWRGDKNLKTKSKIENGNFDLVVLQNHSMRTIEAIDSHYVYGSRWIQTIREVNAEPILYMTWARQFNPSMLEDVIKGYETLAKKEQIQLNPIGLIWQEVKKLRPYMPIYAPDQSHPSPLGTYLNACAFYRMLTGKPATGLPARFTTTDQYGEKTYLMIVSSNDAAFCQSVVDRVFENYKLR